MGWTVLLAGAVGVVGTLMVPVAGACTSNEPPFVDPPSCGPPGCIEDNSDPPPPYAVHPEHCICVGEHPDGTPKAHLGPCDDADDEDDGVEP